MISVIIPMYNAEKTIRRAIESIVKQNLNSYEIIIIDDCSTDNSYIECERYLKELEVPCTKLLKNEKNQGPSYTRNRGIAEAVGKYAILLDSDDYYEDNAIKKMLDKQKEENLVISAIKHSYKQKYEIWKYDDNDVIDLPLEKIAQIYFSRLLNQPMNKLYNLDIIKKHQIKFNEALAYGEDLEFNLDYIKHIKYFTLINEPLLVYENSDKGLNNKYKEDELELDRTNFQYLSNELERYKISLEDKKVLNRGYFLNRIRLYDRCKKYSQKKDKRKYLEEVIQKDDIISLIEKLDYSSFQKKLLKAGIKKQNILLVRIYLKIIKVLTTRGI